MTPTLATENFCLEVGFDAPPVPIQQDQHNMQMIQSTVLFIPILKTDSWLHDTDNHKNFGPDLFF